MPCDTGKPHGSALGFGDRRRRFGDAADNDLTEPMENWLTTSSVGYLIQPRFNLTMRELPRTANSGHVEALQESRLRRSSPFTRVNEEPSTRSLAARPRSRGCHFGELPRQLVVRCAVPRALGDDAWWHHASSAQTRRDRDSGHDVDAGRLHEFDNTHCNNDGRRKDGLISCARVRKGSRNRGSIVDQRQPFDIPRDGLCRTARWRDPGQRGSSEGTGQLRSCSLHHP